MRIVKASGNATALAGEFINSQRTSLRTRGEGKRVVSSIARDGLTAHAVPISGARAA